MATYRQLCNARQDVILELALNPQVETNILDSNKIFVVPIYNKSESLLATFQWTIRFRPEKDKIRESYKVSFTEKGTVTI